MKSKTNNPETFDTTQEIRSVNKQNGTGTIDREIMEEGSEAALAYQSNLLFQKLNQFIEKKQDFLKQFSSDLLSDNVDQKREKYYQLSKVVFWGKEIEESYTVQQKLNQETF